MLGAAAGRSGGGCCAAGIVLGLEVGDFGVAQAVGEGGVGIDFLLALGDGARRGCWERFVSGWCFAFVATLKRLCWREKAKYLHATAAVPSRPSASR